MSIKKFLSNYFKKNKIRKNALIKIADASDLIKHISTLKLTQNLITLSQTKNPMLKYGHKVFSQNDEDGIIQEIYNRLDLSSSKNFLEIGVGDGSENNTLNLLTKNWKGIWLGGEQLAYNPDKERLIFERCWITKDNIVNITRSKMAEAHISSIELISIDIDGNDWQIVDELLSNSIHPDCFIVEYNGTFDAYTHWVMPYNEEHVWDGSAYFSASISAYQKLFDSYGYFLVACNITGSNAFFVRSIHKSKFPEIPIDWHEIYTRANYISYPYLGHVISHRLISEIIESQ